MRRRGLLDQSGFMLIEALTALFLLGVLFALFSSLASEVTTRDTTLMQQSYLAEQARPTLDGMTNELQGAMCDDTTNPATQPITTASATSITFTTPDHLQPFHLRRISYTLQNGTLMRQLTTTTNTGAAPWTWGTPQVSSPAVQSVTNTAVFHYYDSSGNDLDPSGTPIALATTLQQIARVTMTLTVSPVSTHGNAETLTAQESATLRTPWTADC